MELYDQETGKVITETEFRDAHPNVSFPHLLNVETLKEFGVSVVLASPQPTPTSKLEYVSRDGVEVDVKGNVVQKWALKKIGFESQEAEDAAIAESLAQDKRSLKNQVETLRDAEEKKGFTFTFSDGISGTVQLRDQIDGRNITSIATSGLIVKSAGDTSKSIIFRDGEDVIHFMDADEAIALGVATQQYILSTYETAWSLKAQIESAKTEAELKAITVAF